MRMCVFFVSNFPAHILGTITSLDKHLVDWRQSPVLYDHMQGIVAFIVKVQQRTWRRDCLQSREASKIRSTAVMYFWKFKTV